jgi:methyl acetate hydrolase
VHQGDHGRGRGAARRGGRDRALAPGKEYAPEIVEIQVPEGFDADGEPPPRPPKTAVTVEQLMLHNAGFGFSNHDLIRYGERRHVPGVVTATQAPLKGALLFDPGEEREYGSNIDWVGKFVEGVCGKRLGEVFDKDIFGPLGMDSAGFFLTDDMRPRPATMHQREDDGSLRPMPGFELPQDSEQHVGGHGMYGARTCPMGTT